MARNGSGVYTLPEPAFVPNTPISSGAVNNDLSDIAAALTGSVASDGQTTITAALKLDNTGFVYASDPNTGMRRTAADAQAIFAGGVDVIEITSAGVNFPVTATLGGNAFVPAGITAHTAAAAAPAGWLIRDGTAVSRTTYAALFTAIGTTYGAGDGSTTFNLPDARGRVDAGVDGGTNRLPGYALAVVGGLATATLVQASLPNLNFTVIEPNGGLGHQHTYNSAAANTSNGITPGGGPAAILTLQQIPTSSSFQTTGIVVNSGGSSTPVQVVQPTMGQTPIIKT